MPPPIRKPADAPVYHKPASSTCYTNELAPSVPLTLPRDILSSTIVLSLCMLYVQYMAHSNGYIHILLYSVLFHYSVHVSGIKKINNSKQTIAKKLCIELN